MVMWQKSRPCPSCERTGTAGVKCTNCNTVGCSNSNCAMGGLNPFCPICNKPTEKKRI